MVLTRHVDSVLADMTEPLGIGNYQCLVYFSTLLYQSSGTLSPHMTWVGPGEGTFTCQVNRSTEWESNSDLQGGSQRQLPLHYYAF